MRCEEGRYLLISGCRILFERDWGWGVSSLRYGAGGVSDKWFKLKVKFYGDSVKMEEGVEAC